MCNLEYTEKRDEDDDWIAWSTCIHECGKRISARTRTHTDTYVYTGQHRDRVSRGRRRVFLFRLANRARQVRGHLADTRVHVYTMANREFIFYGKLIGALGESFAAPRRSRSRYDKYLYRDRPLDYNQGWGKTKGRNGI